MNRRAFPWSRLGIDPTKDAGAIRKAYADALRATDLDDDIAGYAELRPARDQALWLAKQKDVPDEEPDGLEGGDLDDGFEADPDADFDWAGDEDDFWDDSPATQHPDPLRHHGAPQRTEAEARAQEAWQRLIGVLYPDGDPSDDAVSHAELGEGLAALGVLIARAEEADLAEHDALDRALAELFARTWPRSAPFVEPANAAFHWLDEAGALEERPPLRFLNDRLKGMRFHEKVQAPGHPLHKAWVELSRPGRAGILDRLKVKRLEVHKLLTGIRQRYPELESHLDPERVASWDGGSGTPGEGNISAGPGFRRVLLFVIVIFALVRVAANIMGPSSSDKDGALPVAEALAAAEIEVAVAGIFGNGVGMAEVRAADSVFADQLRLRFDPLATNLPHNFVRMKALGSAEVAGREPLLARADLKALWLAAAQRQSGEACGKVLAGDLRVLKLDLTEKERAREQALLRQLLEAKVLNHIPKGGETRYAIPGWLVADTLKRSGLPEKRLIAAFTDTASSDRCAAEFALVEAVRAAPGKVPLDVLKGL